MRKTDTFLSQVLGTVRHGVGHKDAAGVLTSAGAPLWFKGGVARSTPLFEDETARSRPGGRDHDRKEKVERLIIQNSAQCKRTRKLL
jgi:hypothetical protein